MKTRTELALKAHEIARRLLAGQTVEQIAQETGYEVKRLQNTIRRPYFQQILADLRDEAYQVLDYDIKRRIRGLREEIAEAAVESFDRLVTLLRNTQNENLIRDIAQDFLDRAGYGKTSKVEVEETFKLAQEDVEQIREALLKEKEAGERLKRTPEGTTK